MDQYKVKKEDLVGIVSACQERSYAQELDLLLQQGPSQEWLLNGLKTSAKNGISNEESSILKRKAAFGTNEKEVRPPPGFCELFFNALSDFTLRILIVASILSIVIDMSTATPEKLSTAWVEGAAVMIAVMISASVSAANDYQKERQFQKLNSVADERKTVSVRRGGVALQLHQDLVLVGDLIQVHEGMEIPADGFLIDSNDITTDESAMTGETDPVHKNVLTFCLRKKQEVEQSGEKNIADKHEVPSPILMSGTRVLTGEGKMIAVVVGDQSCLGKIRALLLQDEAQATPLQMKLEKVAQDIGKFGLYSALTILVVLLIRFAIEKGISQHWDSSVDIKEILNYFILSITVVVVAIPQGLPLAVTLSLAFSVKKMLNDQNLVRKMEACETMGGANNICSDKTGTLTMNKMTLTQIWNGATKVLDIHAQKLNFSEISTNETFTNLFKIAACVNGTALLRPQEKGSSTEIAILKYMQKVGVDYEVEREKNEPKLKFPFSSARKRMSVIVQCEGQAYIFVKGASQMVLNSCNKWHNAKTNEVEVISQGKMEEMNKAIVKMAEGSLRTLCLAYHKLSPHDNLQTKDERGVYAVEQSNLVLLAIIGVQDIPRKEVPEAIRKCRAAGITVRMVTGDNIITARAIAKDVGIILPDSDCLVMEGIEFNRLVGGVVCKNCRVAVCSCPRDAKEAEQTGKEVRVDTIANAQEFDKIHHKLLVLARSRPQDKYALVTGLKERGDVVAVTGDGTNDAPALKKADVGFAMGIAGTEVARESAAIILLDDNFNSIVKAVLWGRNIYESIRKFIQFQLTVNIVAVSITLIGAALLKQEILRPIQMLWINLIMDTLASLALATEPPNQALLDRKPHSRSEYIVSRTMFKHIIGQAIFQLIVIIVLVFVGELFIPQFTDALDDSVFATHPEYKWHNGVIGSTVTSGRLRSITDEIDYYTALEETGISSRHFTFIFNTFVMMQVFNFVNCRKLHEEINIFAGITENCFFVVIVLIIFSLQLLLVTFSGFAFGVYSHFGLTPQHWLLSIAIGMFSMVVNLFLKLIPFAKEQDEPQKETGFGNKEIPIKRRSTLLSIKRSNQRIERNLAKNNVL